MENNENMVTNDGLAANDNVAENDSMVTSDQTGKSGVAMRQSTGRSNQPYSLCCLRIRKICWSFIMQLVENIIQ